MALGGAAALLLAAVPAAQGTVSTPVRSDWQERIVVVGYETERDLRAAAVDQRARIVRVIAPLRVAELRASSRPERLAADVARAPGITFVDRLAAREEANEPALATFTAGRAYQWQYAATRANAVPTSVLRAASAFTIGVVDTGADLRAPDLVGKVTSTHNVRLGTRDVRDANGHGTFVASLAAGSITNREGIAGFGGDARLLVVQAGDSDGSLTDVDAARGIVYAVDHGAKILNLSFGGPSTSITERRAIDYAVARGALVIAAAGNDYASGNRVSYPAALLQPTGSFGVGGAGLSVGASTASGTRARFSNTGSHLSLVAPGESVFGALSAASTPTAYPRFALPGSSAGLYGFASGTSFAAPQVAGAAALVWAANPALSAQGVAAILEQTASGRGSWTPELGYGVLDVGAAVARARGTSSVELRGEKIDRLIRLTWTGGTGGYRLSVSVDGGVRRTVVERTAKTSVSFRGARGRRYSFVVSALDGSGREAAVSPPVVVAG